MSTASTPLPGPTIHPATHLQQNRSPKVTRAMPVRRRANMQQGRALETLAHAIEYLVDSRLFLVNEPARRADSEAIQLLARLGHEVFATCAEVIPIQRRLKLWAAERLKISYWNHLGHPPARRV